MDGDLSTRPRLGAASRRAASAAALGSQGGASLVELMVAFLTTTTILGAALSASLGHSAQRRTNAETHLATVAALDTLERARSVDFADLPGLDGTGFDVPAANGSPGGLRPIQGDADGLPGQLSVQLWATLSGSSIYLVTATVEWTGTVQHGRQQFSQLMAERR